MHKYWVSAVLAAAIALGSPPVGAFGPRGYDPSRSATARPANQRAPLARASALGTRAVQRVAAGAAALRGRGLRSAETRPLRLLRATRAVVVRADRRSREFGPPIERATLRRIDAHLGDGVFDRKYRASTESPLLFLRSYPRAFWAEFRRLDAANRIPGGRGLVFGDLHPQNFGFVQLGDRTGYHYNDLDDGGIGSIAVDAVRYFTALRVAGYDPAMIARVLDRYVAVVGDPRRAVTNVGAPGPDWRRENAQLDRLTHRGQFAYDNARNYIRPAPPSVRDAVAALAQRGGPLAGYQIRDVAVRSRDGGGSSGLVCYWVLAARNDRTTVMELKEAAPPAVEQLVPAGQQVPPEERFRVLQNAFWGRRGDNNLSYVRLANTRFVLSDRLMNADLEVRDLPRGGQTRALFVQSSIAASLHAPGWRGVPPRQMREWLWSTSGVLAARWTDAWRDAVRATEGPTAARATR